MKTKLFISYLLLLSFSVHIYSQTMEERQRIIKDYDLAKLDSLKNAFENTFNSKKREAFQFSKENNIPERFVDESGSYHELMYLLDGSPIYYKTHNAGSANTIKVNRINSGGSAGLNLNGQNMILGIWDGGPVRSSHQDLTGRVSIMDLENFVISSEGTSHATHVAGTMLGSGFGSSNARGMAYQATLWGNTFANDQAEAVSQASQGLLVSNHSYGIPAENVQPNVKGAYIFESRQWDVIMNNAPYYQPVISAGNDRGTAEDTKGGRDLLIGNKTSKNSIVVAAVLNVSNYTSPASVTMSTFSSWGPTDDYRIKPDISAKGVNVNSLTSVSDTSYGSNQGTSMSAPAVSGALILLQQHHNELYSNFMRAATLKAVMINGAEETGDSEGPDYRFGWGLLNAQKSALLISNKGTSSIIDELTLTQGSAYSRNIISNGSPMRITVVWNDPAGPLSNGVEDDPTSVLVNDLDVRVTKNSETFYPWVLNPFFIQGGAIQDDNPYDNVESIDVSNPSGAYTITVSHKGNLSGGSQNFSLVVSGVDESLSLNQEGIENLVVYPNPTEGIVNFEFPDLFNSDIALNLIDTQGRLVKDFGLYKFNSETSKVSLDLSGFAKGVYFINITNNDSTLVKKIVLK